MTDLLSQDEIDALLHGVDDVDDGDDDDLDAGGGSPRTHPTMIFRLKTELFVVECRPWSSSMSALLGTFE